MLTFAAAVFFLIATPGPGVLTTAGVGSAYGLKPGLAFVTGLYIGNFLVGVAVVSGLAAVVLSVPALRMALTFASAAYLVYLAARIALAGSRIAFLHAARPPGIVGGIMLQAVNPKAYVVNTMLFSGFAFLPGQFAAEAAIKFAILGAIWIPLHLAWLAAGLALHRLGLSSGTQRAVNVAMALAMLAVVALAALNAPAG